MFSFVYDLLVLVQQNLFFSFGVMAAALVMAVAGLFLMREQPLVERQRVLFLIYLILGLIVVLACLFGGLVLLGQL
ncbi:MAG: hypothetical protein COW24_05095 [Candidatus Kerfeldbacteria bacterium CG15_BIG_FIL_POST_REV_8_21_14_020_45_12]|uniref:Uncharacterized protein n=1 Tax=Candidatus Kerfeldbacteria bacterium CG15_BIG_FIL_POST_REV_8_21_14_020_45_12 TaxID=2014247 RepID=A0A2M7H2V2_9BACT|nr:MAG: hypothetical protein COW24_05095 [Candidatus Kerfeldbacteria bacterium CG15_BIG_FIL_POST_REV_8_21_14_020_45_12]PJA93213.1 MAG: hypothetical protein CO132_03820 [Candidatus Kerfeldbacteria bacterium CG_4_9_14_3_um_filter_45_8]